jgi:hypothetical protein
MQWTNTHGGSNANVPRCLDEPCGSPGHHNQQTDGRLAQALAELERLFFLGAAWCDALRAGHFASANPKVFSAPTWVAYDRIGPLQVKFSYPKGNIFMNLLFVPFALKATNHRTGRDKA